MRGAVAWRRTFGTTHVRRRRARGDARHHLRSRVADESHSDRNTGDACDRRRGDECSRIRSPTGSPSGVAAIASMSPFAICSTHSAGLTAYLPFYPRSHWTRRVPACDQHIAARVRAAVQSLVLRPRLHSSRVHPGGCSGRVQRSPGRPAPSILRRPLPRSSAALRRSSLISHSPSHRRATGGTGSRRPNTIPGGAARSSARCTMRTPGRSGAPRGIRAFSARRRRSAPLRAPSCTRSATSRSSRAPKPCGGSSRAARWPAARERSAGTRCCRPRHAGRWLSPTAIGHTGFTGTSLWIDWERDLYIVLLTNRVHPTRDNEAIRRLRPQFHDAVIAEL